MCFTSLFGWLGAILGILVSLFGGLACTSTPDMSAIEQKVDGAVQTLEQRVGSSVPVGLPAEYADLIAKLSQIVADQGVLQTLTAKTSGAGQNMALGLCVRSDNFFGIGFDGVNGEIMADAGLEGTLLPEGVREMAIECAKDEALPQEQRDLCIAILTANRE